jgi:3-oxoacyl-[acyl-carrier protein] reductase
MAAEARPVVLVTGASGGVGRGIALACAEAGWTVWIAARRESEGQAVVAEVEAAGGRGRFVLCDASKRSSVAAAVRAAVETDGALTGAVHNATSGLSPVPVDPSSLTLQDLRDHVAVSLRGSFNLATEAYPHLVESRGSMVLLTSEAGFEGKMRLAPYAAVKGAVRGLARSWAREWGPSGVRVNCIAPLASSPAVDIAFEKDPTMAERVLGRHPLGYLGDAVNDIGPVVRFLLSSDARYVTGATIMVDGGNRPIS